VNSKPTFIVGRSFADKRGVLSCVNDFNMTKIKRLYQIEHPDINTVRAWQAHKKEQKWFYVATGSFKIVTVKPDNWENPSNKLSLTEFTLDADKPGVLHIPGGYANGFKAMSPHSKMIIFSDFTLDKSAADDYRFDLNLWFNWTL
jgi:dTDP-4-dehydrorhamnose 3,5-epimerase-like enzyme